MSSPFPHFSVFFFSLSKIISHKLSAKPHFQTIPYLPNDKNFPHDPATMPSKSNFHFVNGGVVGEVLGRRGRFGGRGSPLSRGSPPSKVFSSSLKLAL